MQIFMQVLFQIFYVGFASLHYFLTLLFFVCFIRLIFAKYAPYSAFYVASIFFVQAVYNGCPFTEIQSYLAVNAGYLPDPNQFIFGAFESFLLPSRLVFLLLSTFIFTYSYKSWNKPAVNVNFSRCFKHLFANNFNFKFYKQMPFKLHKILTCFQFNFIKK